jgi:hypothetical protein
MTSDREGALGARQPSFTEIVTLLERALHMFDEVGACPSLGARLQGIIDDVQAESKDSNT